MKLKDIFKNKTKEELQAANERIEALVKKNQELTAENEQLKATYAEVKPVVEKYAAHNSALQKQVYELQDRLREATGTAIKRADEITKENLKSINDIKAAVNIVQEKQGMKPKRTRRTKKS